MEAPDKIYVEIRHPFGNEFTEMLGFESRGNSDDIEYIRKDFLLEWAKQKQYESTTIVADNFWQEVIDKLEEL